VADANRRQDLANQGKPIASLVAGVPMLLHAGANGVRAAWDNTAGALGSQVAEGLGFGGGAAPQPKPLGEHLAAGHSPEIAGQLATPRDKFMASLDGMSHHQVMQLVQAMSGLPNQNEQMVQSLRTNIALEHTKDMIAASQDADPRKRADKEAAARNKAQQAYEALVNKGFGTMNYATQGMK
jgi:hypothetical protein